MRRLEAGDTGLQLRGEEDEVMAGLSQGPPSTGVPSSIISLLHLPPRCCRAEPAGVLLPVSGGAAGSQLCPRPGPVSPLLLPAALPPAGTRQVVPGVGGFLLEI